MSVQGAFSASEELAQKVVEHLAGYFDDVFVYRDSQLGLGILWQHTALDDHGVAIGDNDSGAQAVAAASRRVVVDDFHHPTLPHLFPRSVQSISEKLLTLDIGTKPQGRKPPWTRFARTEPRPKGIDSVESDFAQG